MLIKELNEWCRLHNCSVICSDGIHKGIRIKDYPVGKQADNLEREKCK